MEEVLRSVRFLTSFPLSLLPPPLNFFPTHLQHFRQKNLMSGHRWILLFLALSSLFAAFATNSGDADPLYRSCVGFCEESGCVGDNCFQNCKFSSDGKPAVSQLHMEDTLYLRWKQWDCNSDCRYHCMLTREEERQKLGEEPVKYHGKWPFQRVYGIQEPASVIFSAINLSVQFHGWLSFFILVHYNLPLKYQKGNVYEYTGLWHIYGLLSMNCWFWSAAFHIRDVEFTERLDYSSGVALIGFSLILAVMRAFNVRDEAARVMVAAPLVAFVTTHILYLNLYKLDYGWNTKVCLAMGVTQLLIWAIWAYMNPHPSRWKVWVVVLGTAVAMPLEVCDFPPYMGIIDAHALWHASMIPLSFVWWSFVRDDAEYRTTTLLKKTK